MYSTAADRDLRVDATLVGVTFSWALSYVLTKSALADFHPLAFTLARFLLIAALCFLWLRLAEGSVGVAAADLPWLALSGLCGYTLYQLGFALGLRYTSAFSSAVLLATSPLFASGLAAALGLEPVGRRQWLGQLLALGGIALFAGPGVLAALTGARGPGRGDLLSLAGAAAFAGYSVVNRRLMQRYSALRVSTWATLLGTLALVPVALPAALAQDWAAARPAAWWSLAYGATVPITLAYAAWNWAIGRRGVAAVAPFMNLVPVFGGVLAWALLGEVPSPRQCLGAGLVLAGLWLARRAPVG